MSESSIEEKFDPGPAAGVRWNLSDLYAGVDDPALNADLGSALDRAQTFAERYRGRIASLSAAEIAAAIDEYESLQEPVGRAGSFAGLLFAADTSDPRHGALMQSVQERSSEIHNSLVFFELEWVALEAQDAERLLADPELAGRRHLLAALRRYQPHVRSEVEEQLLEQTANTGRRAFSRLFDEVMGDSRFTIDVEGASREVSEEEVLALLYDPDRAVRRVGAASLTQGLRERTQARLGQEGYVEPRHRVMIEFPEDLCELGVGEEDGVPWVSLRGFHSHHRVAVYDLERDGEVENAVEHSSVPGDRVGTHRP